MGDVEEGQALIFDCGTRMIKAGLAGETAPRVVFPTIVGKPRSTPRSGQRTCYIGDDVKSRLDILRPSCPIDRGVVCNWDDIVDLWRHTYSELGVEPEDHPVLLSEASLNPHTNRQKMTQVFFEDLEVPAIYVGMEPVLSLYGSNRTTGVVLECGDGSTQAVPIYEGRFLQHGMNRVNVAGQDLTEYLGKLLTVERGYNISDSDVLYDIKEKLGYVAMDYLDEIYKRNYTPKGYQLPDGEVIEIGVEIVSCPEVHFQPSLVGMDVPAVHELVHNSIKKCKPSLQKEMYENVVLSGGSSMFPGFASRLTQEIANICPSSMNVEVAALPEREYGVWVGGSILASLNTFQELWVSKDDYDEIGPTVVNKKCF